jgi:transcriptional regulator with XRE-family HTH domain
MHRSAQLKATREMAGYSQQALADALGVHVRTVSRWERGALPVPEDALLLVEEALKRQVVDVDAALDAIEQGCPAVLPYSRADGLGNATARQVAHHLLMLGEDFEFEYQDEHV